jgi:hypothetical protein
MHYSSGKNLEKERTRLCHAKRWPAQTSIGMKQSTPVKIGSDVAENDRDVKICLLKIDLCRCI